jgi:hypothetical protein
MGRSVFFNHVATKAAPRYHTGLLNLFSMTYTNKRLTDRGHKDVGLKNCVHYKD